jgi:hypothetical protein
LIKGAALSNNVLSALPDPNCIPLPVQFVSFSAFRKTNDVIIKWETALESGNNGFAIERNINGTWIQIAFVPTQALNGNSDQLLTYSFIDNNNYAKGISQYRIRQVDQDGKETYSSIRAVRGFDQAGSITIYPNPSANGQTTIVFDNMATRGRNIIVSDMSGRIIRQWQRMADNNLQINDLLPGIYMLRASDLETGEQQHAKIVITGH